MRSRDCSQNLIHMIEEWLQTGPTSQELRVILEDVRATHEGTIAEIEELRQSKAYTDREIELIKVAIAERA